MDQNQVADYVAPILDRLNRDIPFVQSLGIRNGMPLEEIIIRAIRMSDPPAPPVPADPPAE